jgi:hypothetical protein
MPPNRRHRIGGCSARRLAFGAESARTLTRWMGRSRPSLARCVGPPTIVFEGSMSMCRVVSEIAGDLLPRFVERLPYGLQRFRTIGGALNQRVGVHDGLPLCFLKSVSLMTEV